MSWLHRKKKINNSGQDHPKQENTSDNKKSISVFTALREVIGGDVFLRDFFQRQFMLILLLFVLSLIYINNRFMYERELRELQNKREELADLQKRSVTVLKDLKRSGRRSVILEELHNQGSDLHENDEPVVIIK